MDGPDQWPMLVVDAACEHAPCSSEARQTLEAVVRLAVELVHEGREGHSIGTLMIVGDADTVLRRSHPLILDPLVGHDEAVRHVEDREFRQTVKELAQLDGAFVVDDDGTFLSAARFVEINVGAAKNLPAGLGARHASAASISEKTDAVAVAVSESSFVRVFAGGALRAEIAPELFLGAGGNAFAMPDPEVHELPDMGLTIALER
ncbi:MAG: diadenylate cyclase [Actinomycetota bacterium]|jgi:diadenylate cyclase